MPRFALPSIAHIPGGRAFASLSRRVRTLTIATVLFVVLFILALTMPVPYVILSPGPTYNTIGLDPRTNSQVIVIDGRTPNHTSGNLNMTTVSEQDNSITAFQAIAAWLKHDEVVVPRTAIFPPGVSEQQTNQENADDFQASQDNATVAALCELGYKKAFGVVTVLADGPSHGVLQPGDQLVSVDGKPVSSAATMSVVVNGLTPGTDVPVAVQRQGRPAVLTVKVGPPPKGQRGARLGVTVSDTCLAPFTVTIRLADIGGPSAGLMFALGIMDKVGADDLTKGRFIAGTGTIDATGKVGPIGGIQLKMIAARKKGASVFLAPAGNCSDVRKDTPGGLQVVKVATLHDAVQDLLKLQKGEAVPGC